MCEIPETYLLQLTFSLRKSEKTYLFLKRYDQPKSLAIIQDFTAHCAMKGEQMAQG
jgi:hypothetical protein